MARKQGASAKKPGQANSSNLDVSIFTVTGEFYLIFFFPAEKRWTARLLARSLARPPPCLLKHSFEMASLTVLLATGLSRVRTLLPKNSREEADPKIQGWKREGGLFAELVQTEHVWLNLTAREGPSSGHLTSG